MSRSNGGDPGATLLDDRPEVVRPGANGTAPARQTADQEMDRLLYRLLELLGEDPQREGLRETPARVRRSLQWLTGGYGRTAAEAVGDAIFEERHGSMVLVRNIELYSLCEHHMLPFFGRAHVAYVPDGSVVGLSKIARMVEVYARRLQVQERLTDQLAAGMVEVLSPRGVGVIIEASHMCMMMRGVQKQRSTTVTSAVRGSLADDPALRAEFLQLAVTG